MNENAKKWIEALRSGRYKQGKGHLRTKDEYCCLGVACELYIEAGGHLSVQEDDGGVYHYDYEHALLPGTVREWLGLDQRDGSYFSGNHMPTRATSLAFHNDHGMTFEHIAAIIEDEPPRLFRGWEEADQSAEADV